MKPGLYETFYGNTAVFKSGQSAFDLDSAEKIPASFLEVATWRPMAKDDSRWDAPSRVGLD